VINGMVWYISLLTMPTALQKFLALASSESDFTVNRVVKRRRDDDDFLLPLHCTPPVPLFRSEKFLRTR
jgi:hypothetical protein